MTDSAPRRPTRRRALGVGLGAAVLAVLGGVGFLTTEPLDPVARYDAELRYRLDDVRAGAPVPRVFLARLDPPLSDIVDDEQRKDVFLRILLPLVLAANEKRPTRRRIPVDMVLAQGAIESGWGTARFATDGNAIFGQRIWNEDAPGLEPKDADGGFRVQSFPSLMASIEAYMQNLNTHPEYKAFRATRKALLAAGQTPTATALVAHITAYSEEGHLYVEKVITAIAENRLGDFSSARLR